jgi:putative solute:sodium symporter small subunit
MERKNEPAGNGDYQVNFFRPRTGYLRRRVTYTWVLLVSWAFFTFGLPLLLRALQEDPSGTSRLTGLTLFGFPFHYWFAGHFLIIWFIFLCILFNLFLDQLTQAYRKRK